MTKKEALQILAILKAAYPHSYSGMSEKEAIGTVTVWCTQFENTPTDIILMAINKLISTNKFPPTIAEVKDKIAAIHFEAYEELASNRIIPHLTAEYIKRYERIYEMTKEYRNPKMVEPSLSQMLLSSSAKEANMLE